MTDNDLELYKVEPEENLYKSIDGFLEKNY